MILKLQLLLVITALLLIGVLIGACGGGGTPPEPATIIPATAVSAAPTNLPATTAPTAVVAAATEAVAATQPAPATEAAAPTDAPTETAATTAPTAETASSDTWIDPTPNDFTKEDIDHIFPPGRGQDLVFQNCTNCHSWVPLVFARMDVDGWKQNRINHESRITALGDEDRAFLYNYILTNFPPDKEPPDNIPQSLLDQWTSY